MGLSGVSLNVCVSVGVGMNSIAALHLLNLMMVVLLVVSVMVTMVLFMVVV